MEIIKRWLTDEVGVPSSSNEGGVERSFANGYNFGLVRETLPPSPHSVHRPAGTGTRGRFMWMIGGGWRKPSSPASVMH